MASNLEEILQQYKQESKGGYSESAYPMVTADNMDEIDNMVYGKDLIPVDESSVGRIYNPQDELEMLKKGLPKDLSNCKLPSMILESFKNKQIDIPIGDEQVTEFVKNSDLKANFDRVMSINEKMEKSNKKDVVDTKSSSNSAIGSIDYDKIRSIIEEVVDEKIEALRELSNEDSSNVKVLKFGDKFLILDEDDSVYECVMEYRGKNKAKKR